MDKVHTAIPQVLGAEPAESSPASFAARLPAELAHWQKVVDASGARID